MKKIEYQFKKSGSTLFVIDGGHSFILRKTTLDDEFNTTYFDVINVKVPLGADSDTGFIQNINNAKSFQEVEDICKDWK